jgi:hypothetical protein
LDVVAEHGDFTLEIGDFSLQFSIFCVTSRELYNRAARFQFPGRLIVDNNSQTGSPAVLQEMSGHCDGREISAAVIVMEILDPFVTVRNISCALRTHRTARLLS